MPLPTRDLTGIPLMSIGGPFRGQGSPPEGDFYTEADLAEIARDTNAVIDEVDPFTKLGHNSAQRLARQSGLYDDDGEKPNTGSWRNFRVESGKLVADVVGMPAKLARLFESGAFRKRSVEFKPYESQNGRGKFQRVIRAVALLGAKAPAVKTLDDVVSLYGDEEIDDADLHVVEYEEEGSPTATLDLQIDLQPIDGESGASADTRGEMPETTEQETTEQESGLTLSDAERDQLAESLGIEGEVTSAALVARAAEVRTLADARESGDEEDDGDGEPDPDGENDPAPPAAGVQLSEAEYWDLRTRADMGARAAETLRVDRRDTAIESAMRDGRITPAAREEFVRLYDEDEDGASRILNALTPNEALAAVYGGDGESAVSDDEQRAYEELSEMSGIEMRSAG